MRKHYALVPAAGSGTRFSAGFSADLTAALPKQYSPLLGRPLLFHSLRVLCLCPWIERVWVVLSPSDTFWQDYDWSALGAKLELLFCGAETRAQSVRNGLLAAETVATADDWILVHDAARPCLSSAQLQALADGLVDDPVGGLLAMPVADTVKRGDAAQRVLATLERTELWLAQTPQMFRYGVLARALLDARSGALAPTDEASAVEALGLQPKLIVANGENLKVTYAADLALAEAILRWREQRAI
ncbi:MAG: 2-C-methyl-D-erythritol 4-phosphate cytidylyltransferase [Pseudomonadota bacterium]